MEENLFFSCINVKILWDHFCNYWKVNNLMIQILYHKLVKFDTIMEDKWVSHKLFIYFGPFFVDLTLLRDSLKLKAHCLYYNREVFFIASDI